ISETENVSRSGASGSPEPLFRRCPQRVPGGSPRRGAGDSRFDGCRADFPCPCACRNGKDHFGRDSVKRANRFHQFSPGGKKQGDRTGYRRSQTMGPHPRCIGKTEYCASLAEKAQPWDPAGSAEGKGSSRPGNGAFPDPGRVEESAGGEPQRGKPTESGT